MTELDLPKLPPTCAHMIPAFGCPGCIGKDRGAEIGSIIASVSPPMCDCGLMMKAGESGLSAGRIRIEYVCQADDSCDKTAVLWSSGISFEWEMDGGL